MTENAEQNYCSRLGSSQALSVLTSHLNEIMLLKAAMALFSDSKILALLLILREKEKQDDHLIPNRF